jgi:hypothetical protein
LLTFRERPGGNPGACAAGRGGDKICAAGLKRRPFARSSTPWTRL